ncbi:MAG: FAD-binding oxidoreductase [Planctomycetes bacterium]|nr:FAD-binding oxidoreductase [Planctomycetota bacterium]
MSKTADIVIIGGGVIGASIAYHLSQAGARNIVLLEKNLLGSGSSGKAAGLTILQWANEIDVQLVQGSLDIYRELIKRNKDIKFHQSGLIYLATTAQEEQYLRDSQTLLNKYNIKSDWLDRAGIRKHLGHWMHLDDFPAGLYTPEDGYLDPFQIVNGFAKEARRNGAKLYEMAPVTGLRRTGDIFEVTSSEGTFSTPLLINAAGCWAKKVGELLGLKLPLKPYRTQIAVLKPSHPLPQNITAVYDINRNVYFHSETGGLLLAGDGTTETEENPDQFRQKADNAFLEEIAQKISYLIPGMADAGVANSWAGLVTATPDRMPIIGRMPEIPNFILATGDNGYGFMRAGMLGKLVAEIALNKPPSIIIDKLTLNRFGNKDFSEFKITQGMGL